MQTKKKGNNSQTLIFQSTTREKEIKRDKVIDVIGMRDSDRIMCWMTV